MKIFWNFFLLGMSFGAGPCLLTCGPVFLSYAIGTGKDSANTSLAYILFSLGRVAVYVVMGIGIFFFGQMVTFYSLGNLSRYFYILAGVFIIVLGLFIFSGRDLNHAFCRKAQDIFIKKDIKTIIMLGVFIGILPCAPLVSVVSYIGLIAKNWHDCMIFCLYFGLGTFLSPLLLLALGTGLLSKIKHAKFTRIINAACGLIMVFLGARLIWRSFL